MPANPVLNPKRWQDEADSTRGRWSVPKDPEGRSAMAGTVDLTAAPPSPVDPDEKVMTIGGTMTATGVLFVLLLATAVFGWSRVTQTVIDVETPTGIQQQVSTNFSPWLFLPILFAVVIGLVTAFKPPIARFTAPVYALLYGITIGAISHIYNYWNDGIVLQAVGATLAVFLVMFTLYATRIIKVTKKYVIVVIAATAGIMLLYLSAWIMSLFGASIAFWNEPSALGIGISVVIVVVAALNLGIDFAFIERASKAGAPRYMEWYGAFGLMVTLIWLYLEILRLLSLLQSR